MQYIKNILKSLKILLIKTYLSTCWKSTEIYRK